MKIGYVGLGALGSELARRFLVPEHDLCVWDLNPAAVQRLANEGAAVAGTAAELAARSDVVLTCLPRSVDVQRLLFGPDGLADHLRPGTLVIDQTSGTPGDTRRMAEALEARGVAMLDAAVSASPQVVPLGAAVLMLSGPDAVVARALPVLHAITATIYRCGQRVGDGQAMKMVNNAMNAGCRMGTLELVAMGRKAGLSLPCMTAVLGVGAATNITTERMLANIAVGKESTNFALALMLKDVNQALELGLGLGMPMALTGAVRALMQIGVNTLGDQARLEQMIGLIESMAGTRLPLAGEQAVALPPASAGRRSVAVLGTASGVLAQALAAEEARSLADPAARGQGGEPSEVIVLCPDAGATALDDLMAAGLAAGCVVLDFRTGDPLEVAQAAARLAAVDVALVDVAFVSGSVLAGPSEAPAVFVAGDLPACGRAASLLQRLGASGATHANATHCGPAGGAQVARVMHGAAAGVNRAMTLECVAVGERYGLAMGDMAQVLVRTSGWSGAGREMLPVMAAEPREPIEPPASLNRDLRDALRLGVRHGAPLLMANAARAASPEASFSEVGRV